KGKPVEEAQRLVLAHLLGRLQVIIAVPVEGQRPPKGNGEALVLGELEQVLAQIVGGLPVGALRAGNLLIGLQVALLVLQPAAAVAGIVTAWFLLGGHVSFSSSTRIGSSSLRVVMV